MLIACSLFLFIKIMPNSPLPSIISSGVSGWVEPRGVKRHREWSNSQHNYGLKWNNLIVLISFFFIKINAKQEKIDKLDNNQWIQIDHAKYTQIRIHIGLRSTKSRKQKYKALKYIQKMIFFHKSFLASILSWIPDLRLHFFISKYSFLYLFKVKKSSTIFFLTNIN